MDYKDIALRSARTFAQAFGAQLVLSAGDFLKTPTLSVAQKLLLAAAVAAATVVWHTVVEPAYITGKIKLFNFQNRV